MQRFFKFPYYPFLLCLILLLVASFYAIYSATYALNLEYFMTRQSIFIAAGLIVFMLVAITPKHFFKDFAPILYLINLMTLFSLNILQWLNIIDQPARWIEIAGITFQPSELMKITLILMLAWIFAQKHWSSWQHLFFSGIATALPVLFIVLQPDLGTAAILVGIFVVMCFLSRLGIGHIIFIGLAGVGLFYSLRNYVLYDYQIERLRTFLNPSLDPLGEGWSINQALIAIGSGGLQGKGFLQGTQSKMGFLPDTQYSDFIFAVIGEEWGFLGGVSLILVFMIFLGICLFILTKTTNYFFRLVIWGMVSYWFMQFMLNVGMNIGLLPVTGVPLPFISYGGTSLLANLIGAGILYHIHLHQKTITY